jgi:hypothetical protein
MNLPFTLWSDVENRRADSNGERSRRGSSEASGQSRRPNGRGARGRDPSVSPTGSAAESFVGDLTAPTGICESATRSCMRPRKRATRSACRRSSSISSRLTGGHFRSGQCDMPKALALPGDPLPLRQTFELSPHRLPGIAGALGDARCVYPRRRSLQEFCRNLALSVKIRPGSRHELHLADDRKDKNRLKIRFEYPGNVGEVFHEKLNKIILD